MNKKIEVTKGYFYKNKLFLVLKFNKKGGCLHEKTLHVVKTARVHYSRALTFYNTLYRFSIRTALSIVLYATFLLATASFMLCKQTLTLELINLVS